MEQDSASDSLGMIEASAAWLQQVVAELDTRVLQKMISYLPENILSIQMISFIIHFKKNTND